jgi:peptidoglycan/xylan/chitin deacetylase (PgdA/CDA1 family)
VVPVAAGVAAGSCVWGAVCPTSELFGSTLHHLPQSGTIALTFDDGPNPSITPHLLSLLERHGVGASFFVVGRSVRACPELLREIGARGHAIGNHTETHPNLALLPASRIEEELARCQDSIGAVLPAANRDQPAWMRPPFGFRGPQLPGAVRRSGLRGVVMWSFGCHDWKPQPATRLIDRLRRLTTRIHAGLAGVGNSRACRGEIVLLHDGDFRELGADRRHVLDALEYWLPRWRDSGIKFVTIDEINRGALSAA